MLLGRIWWGWLGCLLACLCRLCNFTWTCVWTMEISLFGKQDEPEQEPEGKESPFSNLCVFSIVADAFCSSFFFSSVCPCVLLWFSLKTLPYVHLKMPWKSKTSKRTSPFISVDRTSKCTSGGPQKVQYILRSSTSKSTSEDLKKYCTFWGPQCTCFLRSSWAYVWMKDSKYWP